MRPPHPRHRAAKVNQRARVRDVNSVIESWVDVDADVSTINRGEASRQGDAYVIHERTYRLEPGGRVFPVSVPGIHRLGRGAFKALGVYNTFGLSLRAEEILDEMGIAPEERASARRVWESEHGQERRNVGGT